jgi:hypothetical protein
MKRPNNRIKTTVNAWIIYLDALDDLDRNTIFNNDDTDKKNQGQEYRRRLTALRDWDCLGLTNCGRSIGNSSMILR